MPRIRYTVAYDGRPFEGWQSQPSKAAVQDHLELAFSKLLHEPVHIHGSGRTDSGVHALGQIFHADFEKEPGIPVENWPLALNTKLPRTIRVINAEKTGDNFHARFSATGKHYRYTLSRSRIENPFDLGVAWHNNRPIDERRLEEAAALLMGTRNFEAFAALRGNEPSPLPDNHFIRTIYRTHVEYSGDYIHMHFVGNGFMYKMVRLIVGGLHTTAIGKLSVEEFKQLLEHPAGRKSPYCAPPGGLCLMRVFYDEMTEKAIDLFFEKSHPL